MSTISTTNLKNPSSATNNIVLNADGTVTILGNTRGLTLETAKAFNWNGLTTNTSIDFTSIPNWVKRITVMLLGVSTNGVSPVTIRLGTASGFISSNYFSANTRATAYAESTVGFTLTDTQGAASSLAHGTAVITNVSGNAWAFSSSLAISGSVACSVASGSITAANLGGTLDRISITTVNGTDTFDAGSINILYE